jgi:hypothetical protein
LNCSLDGEAYVLIWGPDSTVSLWRTRSFLTHPELRVPGSGDHFGFRDQTHEHRDDDEEKLDVVSLI